MSTVRSPDMRDALARIRSGNNRAVLDGAIALTLRWGQIAGRSVRHPIRPTELLELDPTGSSLLAAAVELRELLAQSPQGRQALRDFGFQPFLEHIEGE